MKNNK